jgi:DNA-directed RNA polymerase specialized sigma24 family protein
MNWAVIIRQSEQEGSFSEAEQKVVELIPLRSRALALLLIQFGPKKMIRLARYSSMSDQELVRACAEDDDSAAWEEFVSRYKKAISLSIIRTAHEWGQTATEIFDDLIQETFLKLYANHCRLLLQFTIQHPEAPVIGYVKTIAINLTHDHFRVLFTEKRGRGQIQQLPSDSDFETNIAPDDAHIAMEQHVILSQIDQCLIKCASGADKDRDLLIFRLYYRQGMSANAIAALPGIGIGAKGVESAIFRLTKQVRERIADTRFRKPSDTEPDEKGFQPTESV